MRYAGKKPAPWTTPGLRARSIALDEVLGPAEAGRIYDLIGEQIRAERVPVALLVLMWVSTTMPVLADRIPASARSHYRADAALSA